MVVFLLHIVNSLGIKIIKNLWSSLDNRTCERRYHFLTFLLMMCENNGKNPHSENRVVSMSAPVR